MSKFLPTLLFVSMFGLVACQKPLTQPTYQVFYYDVDKPNELYPLGETASVAFGYAYDFKGIKGEKLGILWQGELTNPKKDGLIIQHGDKLSLKINGQEIKLSHEPFTELPLEKGKYPVEIRYEPKWHAGDVVLNFLPKSEIANLDELPKTLNLKDDIITFAEIDEQSVGIAIDLDTGQEIEQTLATNTLPTSTLTLSPDMDKQVLVLSSSYDLLNVNIIPNGVKVKAIIAAANVGQITGVDGVPIYRLPQAWDGDWWASDCRCTGGVVLHCSTDEGSYSHINAFTQSLNGQAPKLWYRKELGWQPLDKINSLHSQALQELAEAKAQCGGEKSPTFTNNTPTQSNDNINTENANSQSWLAGLGVNPPEKGFVAYYFNRDDMKTPVATEIVPHIAINYPYEEFHNIPAEQFAAAWTGYITADKDTMMSMQYDLSWSQLRVFLNGKQVYQVRNEGDHFDLLIPKGKHRLDVEHINHWHTVGFALHPQPKLDEYPKDKVKELVNNPAYDVVSVAVHESENRDSTLPVALPNTQKPIVLILKSHNSVFWQLLPSKNRIQAIIIEDGKGVVSGSHAPVMRVESVPYSQNPYQHFYEYAPNQVESHQYKRVGDSKD